MAFGRYAGYPRTLGPVLVGLLGAGFLVWLAASPGDTYLPPIPRSSVIERLPLKPRPSKFGPARTLSLEPARVDITNVSCTCIGFLHPSGPPWEYGNYLRFAFREPGLREGREVNASWNVVNMHAENFGEITRRLNLTTVEVRVLHTRFQMATNFSALHPSGLPFFDDEGYALITDDRIPQEWFLSQAGQSCRAGGNGLDPQTGAVLQQAYRRFFRANKEDEPSAQPKKAPVGGTNL